MIKSSELRLGNWVNNDKEGYIKVSSIYIYGIRGWADLDFDNVPSFRHNSPDESDFAEEEIIGIPLTPEILEKCSFVSYKFNIGTFGGLIIGDDSGDNEFYVNAKYIHQLQNLYFALTGEELEINL